MRLKRLHQILVLAGACAGTLAPAAFSPALAAKKEVDKLSPTVVRDLHFGDALFYYFQGKDFDAITRLFLRPIRRVVPLLGSIDLSPLVLLVLLQVALIMLAHLRGAVGGAI